ncbi:ribosylglycohydrolase [Streptomyces avermitilis]|uniref:Ribosylglycoyhydrolase n=3 Tax=Streptomyces avermitilis TaxID=33903 RepID=Q82D99_STRAW|nr:MULTISPECIES: ADP-ribosylglycohydrolase family protein [Streptomyces]KUN52007.1 ribosylglycohydrolase [Streptomyces avermitilis]MYT00667.1 ADP-ribosylglycohydrolase family protein [Streptomyces sp. SID5469]OOV30334.1 ribosylglycohydrolase [Streptomyces avermitilis]BAC72795.1 putative ribosylglycoyhydrolase [Streptomyces avermitilis MA-4680 = NBRC 14893]GDY74591.1 ribosylglycohydrolase [Streptomyces avermitilis]
MTAADAHPPHNVRAPGPTAHDATAPAPPRVTAAGPAPHDITAPDFTPHAVATVLGSAVGDALGAPFEFGPGGAFSARFPRAGHGSEMCGGGGWDPGEATDDTQMAVLVGESLLECGGLELPDIFRRFQRWAAARPKDIGLQTEDVLTNGEPWDRAAALHFQVNQRAAGNGALMRAATSAVHFAGRGRDATMDAGRRIAALTHGDRAAWEGTAIFHEVVRVALAGGDPLTALPDTLAAVHPDHRARYATVLAPDWHPDQATEFNGAVWPCLGSAVWALRTTDSYEEALRAAVDIGGDTDTVAAVTGGLAGAVYGPDAIPRRWTEPLHVPLPGFGDRVLGAAELAGLARRLAA